MMRKMNTTLIKSPQKKLKTTNLRTKMTTNLRTKMTMNLRMRMTMNLRLKMTTNLRMKITIMKFVQYAMMAVILPGKNIAH